MSKENSRPWYRNPVYLGVIGAVIAAIIGATWAFWLNPPPSDFCISVNPMKGEVRQGGVITTAITIKGIQEYEHPVSLSASGVPSGIVVTFIPPIGGPTPSYTSTVTIDVDPSVSAGVYTIIIKGTGADGKEHSCNYILTVKPSLTPTSPVTPSPSPTPTLSPAPAPLEGQPSTIPQPSTGKTSIGESVSKLLAPSGMTSISEGEVAKIGGAPAKIKMIYGSQLWILYNGVWTKNSAAIYYGAWTYILLYNDQGQGISSEETYPGGWEGKRYWGYLNPGYHYFTFHGDAVGWHKIVAKGSVTGPSDVIWIYVMPTGLTPTPTPHVEITAPTNGEDVSREYLAKGTHSGLIENPNLNLYVLLFPHSTEKWWVQNLPSISSDGSWETIIYFGTETLGIGGDYTVSAIITTKDLEVAETLLSLPSYVAEYHVTVTRPI